MYLNFIVCASVRIRGFFPRESTPDERAKKQPDGVAKGWKPRFSVTPAQDGIQ
jgi:hypothetical protein